MAEQSKRQLRRIRFSLPPQVDTGLVYLELDRYLTSSASLSKFKQNLSQKEGYTSLVYSTVQRMKQFNRSQFPLTDEIEIIPDYSSSPTIELDIIYRTGRLTDGAREEIEKAFSEMLDEDLGVLLKSEDLSRLDKLSGREFNNYREGIEIKVKDKNRG